MKYFSQHIEEETKKNTDYRRVVFTNKLQLVYMSLKPQEEIGEEIHKEHDQFFRFESGEGKVIIDEEEITVKDGDAVIVPAGSRHNVINTSIDKPLKLYTIYAPPEHKDGEIEHTKNKS